jgi:hypothetical protein
MQIYVIVGFFLPTAPDKYCLALVSVSKVLCRIFKQPLSFVLHYRKLEKKAVKNSVAGHNPCWTIYKVLIYNIK